jgi:hypothetical protein
MPERHTLEQLAIELKEVADRFREKRPDDRLRVQLTSALSHSQEVVTKLEKSVSAAPIVALTEQPEMLKARTLLRDAEEKIAIDAIAFATSSEHSDLLQALSTAESEVRVATQVWWDSKRTELKRDVPQNFVTAALNIAALHNHARKVEEASVRLFEILASTSVPTPQGLQQAETAARTIDDHLARLEAAVPVTVRGPLQRAAAGTLKLREVTDEFRDWLASNGLEDAVRVKLQ